jgi:lipoic acid synthetase
VRARPEHVLPAASAQGIEVVRADRGGDVTYHGPGQLVGYPVISLPGKRGGGMADTVAYVASVESLILAVLSDLGLRDATTLWGRPGVWLGVGGGRPRKIAAVGVRITRGRTMHGFALNVDRRVEPGFASIVPCGIADAGVTSLEAEGIAVTLREVVDMVAARAPEELGFDRSHRADVAWRVAPGDLAPFTAAHAASQRGNGVSEHVAPSADRPAVPADAAAVALGDARGSGPSRGRVPTRLLGRLAEAGVDAGAAVQVRERKPEWMRVRAEMGPEYRRLTSVMRSLDLVTVCEEAGCPNIFDCWNDGTATFMVLGERCTRACGFCLVDTRKPLPPDDGEPARVAEAVERLGLRFAVITMVARDDLPDGGAAHVAATIRSIRDRNPGTQVEALISDLRGSDAGLSAVFEARPDVLNHNIETVARLQRAVRPSASYARSLSVLGRAKLTGLTVKSGLVLGMGEELDEVRATLRDLRAVGVDIVTIGQYLRPTARHTPMARWVAPSEFDDLRAYGMDLGFAHVESSPLTRSSYHAREGAASAGAVAPVAVALSPRRAPG